MTTIPIAVSLPIVITVVPLDRRGRYCVHLGARLLVAGMRMPLLDSAHELIRLGADPDAIVVMRHAGAGHGCPAWEVRDRRGADRRRGPLPIPAGPGRGYVTAHAPNRAGLYPGLRARPEHASAGAVP